MNARLAPAAVFVGFALAAGVLQVIATLTLGLAGVDALQVAAREGSAYYAIGALGTGLGLLVLWLLRRRPMVGSVVFFVFELGLLLSLSTRTSSLGLAYHGEYILHHLAALLCAAACISCGLSWFGRAELPTARRIPAAVAVAGATALLAIHVLPQPGLDVPIAPTLADIATGVTLAVPAVALATLWRAIPDVRLRWVGVALLVPLALRVGLAWPEGLSGGSVPDGWPRQVLVTSIVLAATFTFGAFRPRTPQPVRVLVAVLSGLATALIYLIYRRAFGELEDGIGGLAQSLFGFSLPYPTYVPGWQVFVVAIAIFFIFHTVYAGLMSWDARTRGVALGLLAVAGLGLSNPQLVLMVVAGHLLWIDTLLEAGGGPRRSPPPAAIETILGEVAEQLGLPAPVVLETAQGAVVALRGEIQGTPIDLRARPDKGDSWTVLLTAGVVGRDRPEVELVPDASSGGERPEHAIGRTHRARGAVRSLELVGDDALDALSRFAGAHAKFWDAGMEIDFGRDLAAFDPTAVSSLLRAATRG